MACKYIYENKEYTKEEFYKFVGDNLVEKKSVPKYNKILFPLGDTASKIEGHTTLEEFKKQKEDRIKLLEKSKGYRISNIEQIPNKVFTFLDNKGETVEIRKHNETWELRYLTGKENLIEQSIDNNTVIKGFNKYLEQEDNKVNNEISQLKQELERVETEGFGALKPIYNFYENTVTNILKKQGYNPVEITDEYGNKWNEISINQARDLDNILLQRNEANQIIGQANIKAMTVLIAASFKATDLQIENMIKEGLIKKECK